jgi:hypothetical protein
MYCNVHSWANFFFYFARLVMTIIGTGSRAETHTALWILELFRLVGSKSKAGSDLCAIKNCSVPGNFPYLKVVNLSLVTSILQYVLGLFISPYPVLGWSPEPE